MRGPRSLLAAGVLLTLATGACGRNDNPGIQGAPATTGAPSTTAAGAAASGGCAAAAGLEGTVTDKGTAPASASPVAIQAGDFFFAPTCATKVSPGKVKLRIRNTGAMLHNFSVTDRGIDKDIDKGQTVEVEVEVRGGPVRYFCKYHRAAGMVGALLPG